MADFRKFLTGAGVKEIARRWEILRRAVRVLDLEVLCRFWDMEKRVGGSEEALRSEISELREEVSSLAEECERRYEDLKADINDLAQAIADMGGTVPYLRVLPEETQWVSVEKKADYSVESNTEWKAE